MSAAPIELVERHAKALMAINTAVFPTVPDTKTPMCEHGFHDATRDIEVFRSLHGGKLHGLAVATGAYSQVWVLDVDKKHNGDNTLADLERENGKLPETWTAETPSGGWHLYFAWTDLAPVMSRVNVFPGIDTRGAGGYVVAPPTPGYKWLKSPSQADLSAPPEWLINAIMEQQRSAGYTDGKRQRVDQTRYLAGASEGERNTYLTSFTGTLLTLAKPTTDIEFLYMIVSDHNQMRMAQPLPEAEVISIFKSIYKSEFGKR